MTLLEGYPPNIAKIEAVFGDVVWAKGVVFAYGDAVYNPGGVELDEPLRAHEQVHCEQQSTWSSPEAWWDLYLANPSFRLDQEMTAHRAEYQAFCRITRSREYRATRLRQIAGRLSGPLYGKLITYDEAKRAIGRKETQCQTQSR